MTEFDGYLKSAEGTKGPYSDAIDSLFADYDRPRQPGLALCVIKEGKVVHQRGYGVANVEHDLPILPHTVLRLGSVTKHLCATCILILEDRNLLSLNDDVRTHVPEVPDFGETITLRHLLNMTSGFPDGIALSIYAGLGGTLEFTRQQHLDLVSRMTELQFRPGEEVLYSNTNYALLSLIIERLSGLSIGAFMEQELFRPLGMASTRFVAHMSEPVPNKATGYVPGGENGEPRIGFMLAEACGDGGGDTTTSDMAKWFLNYRMDKLIGPTYRSRMEQATPLSDGSVPSYRLGITVTDDKGVERISHTGGMAGYLADFVYYPEPDVGVIILTNWMDPNLLETGDQILELVSPQSRSTPPAQDGSVTTTKLEEGLYICEALGCALSIRNEAGMTVCYMMGDRSPLKAGPNGTFVPVKKGTHYKLFAQQTDPGSTVFLDVYFGGDRHHRFVKWDHSQSQATDLPAYVGRYYSEPLGETHKVSFDGQNLTITLESSLRQLGWQTLTHRRGDVFTAAVRNEPTESNLTLRFKRDESGAVTGFSYSIFRCRNLHFSKQMG